MGKTVAKRVLEANANIILFDGVCNLCNGVVSFIIIRDKLCKFRFASLQSGIGLELCCGCSMVKNSQSIIYIRKGKCLLESTAVLNIFYDLSGIYRIMYIFIAVPTFIRNPIYRLIARNRYRIFGRRDSCVLPTEQFSRYFDLDKYKDRLDE